MKNSTKILLGFSAICVVVLIVTLALVFQI